MNIIVILRDAFRDTMSTNRDDYPVLGPEVQ